MVLDKLRGDVDRQECLAGENLRTGRLEMVIRQFNFVNLSLPKLVAQLTGQVDALLDVGLVGQVSEVAANGIP